MVTSIVIVTGRLSQDYHCISALLKWSPSLLWPAHTSLLAVLSQTIFVLSSKWMFCGKPPLQLSKGFHSFSRLLFLIGLLTAWFRDQLRNKLFHILGLFFFQTSFQISPPRLRAVFETCQHRVPGLSVMSKLCLIPRPPRAGCYQHNQVPVCDMKHTPVQ